MKKLLLAIAALALAVQLPSVAQDTAAPAKTLTPQERDFAVASMQKTRQLFLDSVAGLSPEQWSFKAAPDRWSIAECAEHIALSEDFISGLARNQIMKTPASPEKRAEVKVTDQDILDKNSRSHSKVQSSGADRAQEDFRGSAAGRDTF